MTHDKASVRSVLLWLERTQALGYTAEEIEHLTSEFIADEDKRILIERQRERDDMIATSPPHYIVINDGYRGVHKSVYCACGQSFYTTRDANRHALFERDALDRRMAF